MKGGRIRKIGPTKTFKGREGRKEAGKDGEKQERRRKGEPLKTDKEGRKEGRKGQQRLSKGRSKEGWKEGRADERREGQNVKRVHK